MNRKDKRNMRMDWAFVIFATILSFLINIVSSSVFDMYANGFRTKTFFLFVFFSLAFVFVMGFLSYIVENIDELKETDDSTLKLMWKYVKSRFKK